MTLGLLVAPALTRGPTNVCTKTSPSLRRGVSGGRCRLTRHGTVPLWSHHMRGRAARSADDHVWSAFVRKEQDPLYTTEPLSKERMLFRFPLSSAGGAKPPPRVATSRLPLSHAARAVLDSLSWCSAAALLSGLRQNDPRKASGDHIEDEAAL